MARKPFAGIDCLDVLKVDEFIKRVSEGNIDCHIESMRGRFFEVFSKYKFGSKAVLMDEEVNSWRDSHQALSKDLIAAGLSEKEIYVALEYLPAHRWESRSRIDAVLFGSPQKNGFSHALAVEMKGWDPRRSYLRNTDSPDWVYLVSKNTGEEKRHKHIINQAVKYTNALIDMSILAGVPIWIDSCAYLYNCRSLPNNWRRTLEKSQQQTAKYHVPLITAENDAFQKKLIDNLGGGEGHEAWKAMIKARYAIGS